jgi:hypothetical protein
MLTLAAADTIAGVAQTPSTVTSTIFGMELNAGAETYKVLDQRQLAAAAATIYTAPASTTAFVKTVLVVNTDQNNTQTFQLFRGGTAAANAITPAITIPAGGLALYEDGEGWTLCNNLGQKLGLGATGAQGSTGATAPSVSRGDDGEDAMPSFLIPNRAQLPGDGKPWTFLGTISGTGVTVGPLVFPPGDWQQIYGEYIIGGYNGGTPVGRLLCGSASISTTALTNGNRLSENDVTNATSVSVPGCPLAVALSSIARMGHFYISGASGSLKQIRIDGMSGNPAVATSPADFHAKSFFSDLGTNLLIKRLQLTVYDTLIATAASVQTFTATTALWAWGRMND